MSHCPRAQCHGSIEIGQHPAALKPRPVSDAEVRKRRYSSGVAVECRGHGLQGLASLTRLLWLGPWPHLLAPVQRWRVTRRRQRWQEHIQQCRALEQAHPHASRTAAQQEQINAAAQRANRIAWAEPGRPTWMGDRIHALEQIAHNRYGLDLTFAWPRLWLVLPDTTRSEITAAHAAFAAAVATGTWAWPYLLLATLWWPAALIAVAVGASGWARARAAIADLTALSEAAVDLHGRALALALGVAEEDSAGPLTLTEGEQLTRALWAVRAPESWHGVLIGYRQD